MSDRRYTYHVKLPTIKIKAVEEDTSFGKSKSCLIQTQCWQYSAKILCNQSYRSVHVPSSFLPQSHMLVKSCLPR